MEHLFLNLSDDLKESADRIFAVLEMSTISEGYSLHRGGIYYEAHVFGMEIAIELNSYDWDDKYKIMIGVYDNRQSTTKVTADNTREIAPVIADILCRNLRTEVALEIDNYELKLFNYTEG